LVFLGIDIAKASMDCAILAGPGGKPLGRRSFPNSAEGVDRAVRWAARVSGTEVAETHVVVEATAAYHELAAHRLAAAGMRVSIVNPARVRSFARVLGILGKTDRIDAQLLARYGQLVGPKLWSPPAKALLDLRSLIARLDDLEADLRREENRLEQARTRGCPELVQRSLLAGIAALEAQAGDLRRGVAAHVAADAALQADLERLMTIPAVGPKTATRMLLMLRSRAFDTARQAAAFLGLVPVERTSGTSVRGGDRPCPGPAIPDHVLPSTWPPSSASGRTPTSEPNTAVCLLGGSAGWQHSVPPCASSCISASAC
jgi:transposase